MRKTVVLGLNELGQVCINQHGNILTGLKCVLLSDELARLLSPGTSNPEDIRMNEIRLRAFYKNATVALQVIEGGKSNSKAKAVGQS